MPRPSPPAPVAPVAPPAPGAAVPPLPHSTAPAEPRPQLILAFDFGRRRIGVACGDTLSRTANPLAGIANDGAGPRWDAFDSLMRDWLPSLLVIGLPYNVDGSEGAASRAVRAFAEGLADRYGVPVSLVDERYSSLEGASRLRSERARGVRKRRVGKADVDAAAACVILERWFSELGSSMPLRAAR